MLYIDASDATSVRIICSYFLFMMLSDAHHRLLRPFATTLAMLVVVEVSVITTESASFARGPPQQVSLTETTTGAGSLFSCAAKNICIGAIGLLCALAFRIVGNLLCKHDKENVNLTCGIVSMLFLSTAYFASCVVADGMGESNGASICICGSLLSISCISSFLETASRSSVLVNNERKALRLVPLLTTELVFACAFINSCSRIDARGFTNTCFSRCLSKCFFGTLFIIGITIEMYLLA